MFVLNVSCRTWHISAFKTGLAKQLEHKEDTCQAFPSS
jgi:hypothetical protein